MTVPSYTSDLSSGLLDECNTDTGYVEPTATGWAQLNAETFGETDLFIQGTTCISATCKTGVGATMYDATSVTIPTDGAFLVWVYWAAPNSLDIESNGGIRTIIATTTADFYSWIHGGKDTYTYGGWINLATNPTVTPDYNIGSGLTTNRYFGWAYNALAVPGKGNPYCVDVMRYGRCEARFEHGSTTDGYCTFAGFAAINDDINARWGLIQSVPGGYLWKGLITLGYGTTGCDFRDSNKQILIDNTKKVTKNFNRINVEKSTTRVDFTAISIQALGSTSRGNFEMVDNADVNFESCTFTDMGTFVFQSNATVNDTIFRRCSTVGVGGGLFNGCTFTNSIASAAITASSPANAAKVTNASFVSSGTGHGIEITGTAANMTLTNVDFVGYAASDGSSGNEAVYVNITGGSMNLTVDGGTTPSVRTAGASVTVVAGAVSATVTVTDTSGIELENVRVLAYAITGGPMPANVVVTITNSGVTGTVSHTSHGMATNDKVMIKGASHYQNNGVFTITKNSNDSYWYVMPSAPGSDPTGTIRATYVALSGTTDVNGEITMSRVFASDQPISGRARLSTSPNYYKTTTFSGTIYNDTGFNATVQLLPDI